MGENISHTKQWESFIASQGLKQMSQEFKTLIRTGIPDIYRQEVWNRYTHIGVLIQTYIYATLCSFMYVISEHYNYILTHHQIEKIRLLIKY